MKIGDLIKYHHPIKPEECDTGIIVNIQAQNGIVDIHWGRAGIAHSTIDKLTYHGDRFKVISESR